MLTVASSTGRQNVSVAVSHQGCGHVLEQPWEMDTARTDRPAKEPRGVYLPGRLLGENLRMAVWSRQALGLWAEGDEEGISHQRALRPACWPRSDACLEKRTGKRKADRSLGERSLGEQVGVFFASITQDAFRCPR